MKISPTYRNRYPFDYDKEVCFAAEWVKRDGELKAKSINTLVLLSLENLRDLATVEAYKRQAAQQPVATGLRTRTTNVSCGRTNRFSR